MMQYIH